MLLCNEERVCLRLPPSFHRTTATVTVIPVAVSQNSETGETINPGSASVLEGYDYCTSNWSVQTEDTLFTPMQQRSSRLQAGDYTAPVLPEVVPGDVVEVEIGVIVSFQFRGLYRGVCTVGVAFARIL